MQEWGEQTHGGRCYGYVITASQVKKKPTVKVLKFDKEKRKYVDKGRKVADRLEFNPSFIENKRKK